MIAFQIENIKDFMVKLLTGEMFDKFHVGGCEVTTFVTFQTDGRRHDGWYDADEEAGDASDRILWRQLRPVVFELVRGKKTPGKLLVDFCHYMANGDVASLRVQFENGELHIFTGYMQREFSLDREAGRDWDDNCKRFLREWI